MNRIECSLMLMFSSTKSERKTTFVPINLIVLPFIHKFLKNKCDKLHFQCFGKLKICHDSRYIVAKIYEVKDMNRSWLRFGLH